MAHEIRNPLNIIGSALYDLDEILRSDDPEVREDLTIARDEIARVQEIINAVLDFARSGSSEREWFDLRQLVEQTVALLRKSMATRDVELDLELGHVPPIHAERGGLRQVALNLLTNSFQATPDGGRIGIRLWQADDDVVALSISDTGQGIPAEQISRIFNPFYTTKAPGEGTGLGLSIVYTTIQRHGGQIHVESTPGHGTTFHIRLPRESADEPVPPTPLTAAAEELLYPPPPV
ncbi:MAG: HAMP domain-containing histidine kinase [Armatimonadetes bacterium]|nr:HAMP domain-containing histidine kinase [Armatimonadota bacterium]